MAQALRRLIVPRARGGIYCAYFLKLRLSNALSRQKLRFEPFI
jgi:hypothetical protein